MEMVGLDNDHPVYSPCNTLTLVAFINFGYQIRKIENIILFYLFPLSQISFYSNLSLKVSKYVISKGRSIGPKNNPITPNKFTPPMTPAIIIIGFTSAFACIIFILKTSSTVLMINNKYQ